MFKRIRKAVSVAAELARSIPRGAGVFRTKHNAWIVNIGTPTDQRALEKVISLVRQNILDRSTLTAEHVDRLLAQTIIVCSSGTSVNIDDVDYFSNAQWYGGSRFMRTERMVLTLAMDNPNFGRSFAETLESGLCRRLGLAPRISEIFSRRAA